MPDRTADLLIRVAEFLRKLPAEHLDALASGEARLDVVFKTARPVKPVALNISAEQVSLDLKALPHRSAALQYLAGLRLKRPEMAALATQLGVPFASKDSLSTITTKIVEQKIGQRLDAEAIFERR